MGTNKFHDFSIGQNIVVTDKCSSVGIYQIPCYVVGIDEDYYIIRKRDFTSQPFRVGKYYPHMVQEN